VSPQRLSNRERESRRSKAPARLCQPFRYGLISTNVIPIWLVFFQSRVTVQLNVSERENGQLPLAERAVRGRIPEERWEQIKTAHASGIGLREIARNMGIPEGPSSREPSVKVGRGRFSPRRQS
jgi:hypothetical protein